ncbi:MAG: PspC domain-containing protein [Sphingomonas bacterium]|nr:PspC domain-containing protein [Sphingomonas bacterium]
MPQANLFNRHDTMFGVCQGLGDDFGFHPNLLRLALGASFYFAPLVVIAIYCVLGVLVAASRWLAPNEIVPAAATATAAGNDSEALRLAA